MRTLGMYRSISPSDQTKLRERIPELRRKMPDQTSLKWRPLGEIGVTLLSPGEYAWASTREGTRLTEDRVRIVQKILNTGLVSKQIGQENVEVAPTKAFFVKRGPSANVAYSLEQSSLANERDTITHLLDHLGGVDIDWRQFYPHITIGTLESPYADNYTLKAFKAIMPEILTLEPIVIQRS